MLTAHFIATLTMLTASQASQPQPADITQGRRIVHATCETCHSLRPGVVRVGPSLYGAVNGTYPRLTPAAAKQTVLHGRNKMPAYASVFDEHETAAIIRYLESLP